LVSGVRVAYVVKMYPRFSETFILSELLELERQGVELHVFSLKRPNDGIAHADVRRVRAPVTYLPESLPGLLWAQRRTLRRRPLRLLGLLVSVLRKRHRACAKHVLQASAIAPLLLSGDFDHLHAHFASGTTSVALHASRLTGIPYSFTAHAKDIFLDSVRPSDLARKLGPARFAVTVSDYNARYLRQLANGTPIVRVYNGLDLQRFAPNGTPRERPPLVLAVGRLIEKKGFDVLIHACRRLAAGVVFRCDIVGKGPLEDELSALVARLDLTRRIRLLGPLPRERLVELYPRAAVVAAPCVVGADGNRDGLPTVLIEAMAVGVPVVATPVTGIPELVEDGVTGLLVQEGDPDALAHALERLLADEALAQDLAAAARRRVEERFDLGHNVARLRQLFEEATA
jgi:glycosyltransferase involved in cell wall biosynthesis